MPSLEDILKRLIAANREIKSIALVTNEGLPIISMLPYGINESRIAAMTATILSLAEKSLLEMKNGLYDFLYIKGEDGYILVFQAGPSLVLMVSTTKDVRLGLIFLECKRVCEKIAIIFRGGPDDGDYYPFPYIFNPPEPPDDISPATVPQKKVADIEIKKDFEQFCRHCGAELPPGQTICHVCGRKVD